MSSTKIFAALSIIVGGLGTILGILIAFGVSITPDQHTAIIAAGSLLLLIAGVWLHPDIPVGNTTDPAPTEGG